MKKILTILIMLGLTALMFAGETITFESDVDELEAKLEATAAKLEQTMDQLEKSGDKRIVTINVTGNEPSAERAYMGVYYEDLDLSKVRELNYPENYGVLITGTGAGSPAHVAGIAADDILMEIDGKKCIDKDKFVKIVSSYMPGQTVPIKIFSNGTERVTEFTFGLRPETKKKEGTVTVDIKKKKASYPFVELMYTPVWYVMDDIDDLNGLFTEMGFDTMDENGTLYNGFDFRFNVGKGVYIGGDFVGYSITRKDKHIISTSETNPTPLYDTKSRSNNVIRRMEFTSGWGAVTIDKKFMVAKWFQPSFGVALGGGTQQINFTQTDGGYDWANLSDQFDSASNNAMTMNRSYFIVKPKADIYIGILSWLGLRAEGSYMLGYSPTKGWTETSGDYLIDNSPDTTMNGYAISIGPWIQF